MLRADVHGRVQDSEKDDSVVDGAVVEDEPMHIPAADVWRQFGPWAAQQIVAGKKFDSLVEQPHDHFSVLRATLGDVVEDGNVVLPALEGAENACHWTSNWKLRAAPFPR